MALSSIADWVGSSIVENLVSAAYSYLLDRMLPSDSEAELKRLQTTLPQIRAVMGIAEALKMKHPDAGQWVEQFRQALEASEDMLDELEYKNLEDMVKNHDEAGGSASSYKKGKTCTINDDTLERLKEAVTMLDRAAAGVEHLLRLATVLGIHGLSESRQEASEVLRRQTTSFLAEREVFGREVEKHKIIDWLKRRTDTRLASFGIVGVGGQGKTTLVQFAYQEFRGLNHFDKTIWVCVSTKFSVEDITRKMLSELGENSCCGKPLNALQETLKEKIHSKKVLLVLDDVWDDERRDWEQLIAPLRYVQEGSKILFTTRMKSVANLLASVISTEHELLALQGLGEQELRLLFYSYAFHGSNPDNHRDLLTFEDQIQKMLRGSPLAAKVIGSLLNSGMDHQYWTRILNHGSLFNLEEAKDVMEVLKLSYYHLPADLQVCFKFCSTFPQDFKFDKDELIKRWMAVGIIQQQQCQGKQPEDIGQDYFNHLLKKSFFEYFDLGKGERRYVMHDLVHELAQNVSYGECCRIEHNDKSITIPSTVRHVFVHESEIQKISHLENLRSLVIATSLEETGTDSDLFVLPKNLIKRGLRLLEIGGTKNCELHEEISYLVHLRYLSIDTYNVTPSFKYPLLASVYKLYHLQVLEFPTASYNSSYLGIETTGITNLLRLRYMRLPKMIMQTIHGVHKLTSLQELTLFVGQESGQRINELSTLTNLRHLFIENVENVEDPAEAKSANLLGKNNLMSLSLKWTSDSNPDNPEQIIEYLQPHPNLKELIVENYKGQSSPTWMEESLPLNLSSLKLFSCFVWKNQLFSWQMPYLKILHIYNCVSLDKLPDMPLSLIEFRIRNVGLTSLPNLYQSSGSKASTPLSLKSSLRVVQIKRCLNLISLDGFLQQGNLDLQATEKLTINDCERLGHLPAHGFGNLTSLIYLTLRNSPKLVAMDFQGYLLPTKLQRLNMGNCGELDVPLLEASSGLTTLSELQISNANVTSFTASHNSIRSLKSFKIWGCTMFVEISFQEEAHGINQEKNFNTLQMDIRNCPNLIKLPSLLPLSLTTFLINNVANLTRLPSLPLSVITFSLDNVGLSALPQYYQIANSSGGTSTSSVESSLRIVRIINCQNLTFLNGFLQQHNIDFQSIEKITISNCRKLVHLPVGAFGKFVSLKILSIRYCPMLVAVDNQNNLLPTKLEKLSIAACGELDVPLLESASSLATLTDLSINNCANISLIPSSENAFGSLISLSINGCDKLIECSSRKQAHGDNRGRNWVSLKLSRLEIDHLSLLHIEPLRSLRSVSFFRVMYCSGMQALPEQWFLQNSSTLSLLSFWNASTLKSLPKMASLTTLKYLEIWKANLLQELPELPASLRKLDIRDANSLKSLPATMARLTTLEYLNIEKADLLEKLPELPACLQLKHIEGCGGRCL